MNPANVDLVQSLVASLPRGERAGALHELLDAMELIYRTRRMTPPAWTSAARERVRSGDGDMIDGPGRNQPG